MNKMLPFLHIRKILECRCYLASKTRINAEGKDVPKEKKIIENRITLISPDNTTSILDLKSAQTLAIRRDLKLVKIDDVSTKTRRPVYKLMTSSEYHNEDLKQRKEKQLAKGNKTIKGEKLLNFSTKIGEHDLMTYVKKMVKLVEKQYEVRVVINVDNGEDNAKSESMYSIIERHIKDSAKAVQKRNKGNSLRFQLIPLKTKATATQESGDENSKGNDKGPL